MYVQTMLGRKVRQKQSCIQVPGALYQIFATRAATRRTFGCRLLLSSGKNAVPLSYQLSRGLCGGFLGAWDCALERGSGVQGGAGHLPGASGQRPNLNW